MKSEAEVTRTIWLKAEVCTIKRDLRCAMNATFVTKLAFYEKTRGVCRELVSYEEFSNAADMYSRCVQVFKSIPKIKLELFSDEDTAKRNEAMTTLYTNLSFCLLKKDQAEKAIKAAENAIEADPGNFKAHYRMALAWKHLNGFEASTESFKQAIKLAP